MLGAQYAQPPQYGYPQPPVSWVPCNGNAIPPNAIQAGREADGKPLFVARASINGGVHIGKACQAWRTGANISFGGREVAMVGYEVLVGNPAAVRWVPQHSYVTPQRIPGMLVQGGHEPDGQPLFVARATYMGGVHPGKAGTHLKGAHIAYGGEEFHLLDYEVLVLV
ncbi:hypothetical protein HK105_204431 [Polyrhizophydium stewartii]|uniref:Uncharacterized protein n=1 Tax=Polyrhizophydium stewartii TaxID=2732419 RepID=A0ABR4N918_9FUNG